MNHVEMYGLVDIKYSLPVGLAMGTMSAISSSSSSSESSGSVVFAAAAAGAFALHIDQITLRRGQVRK